MHVSRSTAASAGQFQGLHEARVTCGAVGSVDTPGEQRGAVEAGGVYGVDERSRPDLITL